MSVEAFYHKLTHQSIQDDDICSIYLQFSKEWNDLVKSDHPVLVEEIEIMFARVRSTLVEAFHHKLHHQAILIEDARTIYDSLSKEWRRIKKYARLDQEYLVKEIAELFAQFSRNFLELKPLVNGQLVCEEVVKKFRTVTSWITVDQLKTLPKGYGGRVGVILQTPNKYVLNTSIWGQISDFGGGLKAKHTPYEGLVKELSEECPQWLDYILNQIDSQPVEVSCRETFHRFDDKISKTRLRFSILVFVPFDIRKLSTFEKSPEVKEIVLVNKSDVKALVEQGNVNRGIVHLSKVK